MRGRITLNLENVAVADVAELCQIRNAIEEAARAILADRRTSGRMVTVATPTHDRIGRSIAGEGELEPSGYFRPVVLPAPWGRA